MMVVVVRNAVDSIDDDLALTPPNAAVVVGRADDEVVNTSRRWGARQHASKMIGSAPPFVEIAWL
jgi:hypothetical protein